jgi:phosphate starvation-inducible protein PhoH and related proteins
MAGPLHQRGGAPRVRSRATISVPGLADRAHVKIDCVPECLFCSIVAGDVPASLVRAGTRTVARTAARPSGTCTSWGAGRWPGRQDEPPAARREHGKDAGPGGLPGREGPLTDNPGDTRTDVPSADGRAQVKIVIPDDQPMVSLLGSRDELLDVIERRVDADIHVRGNEITVTGPAAETAVISRLFEELTQLVTGGAELTADSVERSLLMLRRKSGARPAEVLNLDILSSRGRTIRPKTLNQKRYVDAIDNHTIVFSIGPAGTGKTYLAMAKAVKALQAKEVNRIILTRPAVEAGERLGFLPGTLYEKIDPYLRPLYDALHDMVDPDSIPRLTAAGTIEIAPLAYMRGRTLNDSFIILDEAQNTSAEQMKMFLTRLGFGSRMVVTGDVTQVDLPSGQLSGLRMVQDILAGVDDVYFSRLTSHDVVRHKLVADIVDAYERYDARQSADSRLPAGQRRGGRPAR